MSTSGGVASVSSKQINSLSEPTIWAPPPPRRASSLPPPSSRLALLPHLWPHLPHHHWEWLCGLWPALLRTKPQHLWKQHPGTV